MQGDPPPRAAPRSRLAVETAYPPPSVEMLTIDGWIPVIFVGHLYRRSEWIDDRAGRGGDGYTARSTTSVFHPSRPTRTHASANRWKSPTEWPARMPDSGGGVPYGIGSRSWK